MIGLCDRVESRRRWVRIGGVAVITGALLAGCGKSAGDKEATAYPHKPVKVIVPFAAGGGSDQFVRILQRTLREEAILPHPLVVINVPGAGGSIGSRRVKDARGDGYTILNLHEGMITAKYAGITPYGPEAFVPIAGTGRAGMVICVSEASPYKNLRALTGAAAAARETVTFGANVGAPSYFAGRRIEAAAEGCAFRYVQTGGGAKRFAALDGGHIDVSAFSIAEFFQFRKAGLRALAFLGSERHHEATDIPTAREQGIDVVSSNLHFWWAPRGTPADRVERIASALEAAMGTEEVREKLAALRVEPVVIRGDALRREIAAREEAVAEVGVVDFDRLANLPAILLVLAGLLGAGVLAQWWRGRCDETGGAAGAGFRGRRIAGVLGMSSLYVAAMGAGWLTFPVATLCFVPALGLWWRGEGWKGVAPLVGIGALLGWGCYFLFTQVFVIDLP